jgi:hypothetical protein
MKKLAALLTLLALVLAACGGGTSGADGDADLPDNGGTPDVAGACLADDPDCQDIGDPNAPTDTPGTSDEPVQPVDSLSVADVLAAGTIDGSFVIRGYVFVAADGSARICDAILELYPPQCGGDSIALAGDLSVFELTTDQDVTWSDAPLRIEGTFDGTTFTAA